MTKERIFAIMKFPNTDAKVKFNSVVYSSMKEKVQIDNHMWPLKFLDAPELEAV